MELRDLLNEYDFPGDDTPIIKGSALNALNDSKDEVANKCIVELMEACDSFIPEPCLLYTSPSPRDVRSSRMPSSA